MPRPQVQSFPPDAVLRARLRKLCTAADGLVFADVRWWEQGGCLAIWELRQNRQDWIVRNGLRDSMGRPRQVNESDIKATEKALHEARNAFDRHWYDREIVEHNRRVEERAKADFDDEAAQIVKMAGEMERRGHCWHGNDPATCETCIYGERVAAQDRRRRARVSRRRGVRVVDRRRVV